MVPQEVIIVGHRVKIEYPDVPTFQHDDHPGDDLVGVCDMHAGKIMVSAQLTGDSLKTTVLHECLHGMADTLLYGWNEQRVQQAEVVMFALMKSNPQLVRWIIGDDNAKSPSVGESDR